MTIQFSTGFKRQYRKLSQDHRKKFDKQLSYLMENPRHPSLRSKKMAGAEKFEARLDRHFRFTYLIATNEIWLLTIGPHDVGLGKK